MNGAPSGRRNASSLPPTSHTEMLIGTPISRLLCQAASTALMAPAAVSVGRFAVVGAFSWCMTIPLAGVRRPPVLGQRLISGDLTPPVALSASLKKSSRKISRGKSRRLINDFNAASTMAGGPQR